MNSPNPADGEPRHPPFWLGWVRRERLFFVLAIVIGIVAGLAVVAFDKAITWLQPMMLRASRASYPMHTFIVPVGGGLLVGWLVLQCFPRARGSGVNQTKAALYIYDGYIPFRTVVGKFITASLSIASGQSLGPEDPSLQLGAGLASLIGRRLGLSRARQRLLAPLGAAAGLAAAFNAPIAAVLFVIEEVIGRWSSGVIGAVVLAAASATVVARYFFGDTTLFSAAPRFELRHPVELIAYAVLGVAGGFGSLAFVKSVAWLRPRLMGLPRAAQYFLPAAAGLALGVISLWFPQVLGRGYNEVNLILGGHYLWPMLIALALFKTLATVLSFSSGAPGGMFAPTLFIGAALGGAVGGIAHAVAPASTAAVGVYALVGMGTAFAGILRAPMTSVFMVIEVSGSYDIVLPLMISNTIAYVIARRFQPVPIFDLLTQQDGLHLPSMEERREEEVLHVEDAMRPAGVPVIRAERTVGEALALHPSYVLVEGGDQHWFGVDAKQLAGWAPETPLATAFAGAHGLPLLYPDQPLETFLREAGDAPFLPVVHRAHGVLLGVVGLKDVLLAYKKASNED